ncbi:uncharacterized protein BJ171DRAFT_414284, partial [Polychytrium aggregatum]|uniref:uncharacterized protein n=1 Tax=Polychytrium aggregatum TaxID=110093 RepID=UPI0022FE96E3
FHCPFPICREAFARRYNLKTHFSARHAQIKSYICEECGRSFARRYDLNRH